MGSLTILLINMKNMAKIYYMGHEVKQAQYAPRIRRVDGTFKSRMTTRMQIAWYYTKVGVGIGTLVFIIAAGSYTYGQVEQSRTMEVVNNYIPAPTVKESMAVVMQRIAGCESEGKRNAKGKQFNADGTIVTHVNADGTTDVGKYQINMQKSHIVNMARLGFNPLTEEGNEAYAKWLYENKGTGDWSSSANCWK